MAQRTGLEPATPGVTGRYSNQLNYRCVLRELALGKHVTSSGITTNRFVCGASSQASLRWKIWRSGRDSNPRPPA